MEWNLIGTAITNIEGKYEYIWKPDLPPGKYVLKANYTGSEGYNSCQTVLETVPEGLLVIPETQHGPIIALISMFIALCVNSKRCLTRTKWISNT
jgi:acyl-homoserine lactone acylase PvdQ